MWTIVHAAVADSECYWDAFLPEFRAIISLSKTLFRILPRDPSLGQKGGFSLDISLVPPLYILCKYCRDGGLRREAMALIEMCPKREGVWDGGMVNEVSRFLISVEEEGAIGGYIPELARARITRVAVDVLTKTAEVECQRRRLGTDKVIVLKKKIQWD